MSCNGNNHRIIMGWLFLATEDGLAHKFEGKASGLSAVVSEYSGGCASEVCA